jgi:hypothetical protein
MIRLRHERLPCVDPINEIVAAYRHDMRELGEVAGDRLCSLSMC